MTITAHPLPMTTEDVDAFRLAQLDFAPLCEVADCDQTAAWIAYRIPCCPTAVSQPFSLICDVCHKQILETTGIAYCTACRREFPSLRDCFDPILPLKGTMP